MRFAFIITILLTGSTVVAQVINRAEYFIDTDPGNGNGTAVTISSPSAIVNFSFTVPTTSLASGFHLLGFRSRQSSSGFWSHATYSTFYIVAIPPSQNATNITKAEYFYDVDPGNGSGVNVPIGTSASITSAFNTPTTTLAPGFHTFHFRTKDDLNKWSIAHVQTFYIVPPPPTSPSVNLVKAEYFFDTDPGQGNGVALTIAAGPAQNNSFPIPITGLTEGFHRLNVRYKDNAGMWSLGHQQTFYVIPQNSLPPGNVTRIEYYVDTDPGYGQGTAAAIIPAPNVDLLPMPVNTTGIPSGNHVLYVRAKDDKGFWSDLVSGTFNISTCIPPAQPVVSDQSRCDVGTITFTATGATGTQEYHWYDDPIAGSQVGIGSPFTTASLSTNKLFYATIFDPTTLCESARLEVEATVVTFPKPSLNTSGTITLCENGSIFLQAPSGYNAYQWSAGQTTQQITASVSGAYFVSVGDGKGCFSASSDPVTLSLIPAPAKPLVQITGDICSGGSVVLSAPAGFEYVWSIGVSTPDITVTDVGSYFVSVRNATGCLSVPSDPITITNASPASVSLVGDILVANAGDSYQWYLFNDPVPGATKQSFEIDLFEYSIHSVDVTTNGCTSHSEDFEYLITSLEKDKAGIKLYPNPVLDELSIETTLNLPYRISIINMLGIEQMTTLFTTKDNQAISLKELPSGSYVLLIQSNQSKSYFKVVKQ